MKKAKNSLIRTFGRRHGKKLSARQQNLIDNALPALLPAKIGTNAILEIGFGAGEHLAALSEQYPDKIILGAEPFINGVAQLLSKIADEAGNIKPEYKNIRIWPDDARELLAEKKFGFDKIFILHPDPWPKARHEKRRLLSAEFLEKIADALNPDGEIIIGTDHTDYYNWILEQAAHTGLLIKTDGIETIKTRYQEKNMFGSNKTMYVALSKN